MDHQNLIGPTKGDQMIKIKSDKILSVSECHKTGSGWSKVRNEVEIISNYIKYKTLTLTVTLNHKNKILIFFDKNKACSQNTVKTH